MVRIYNEEDGTYVVPGHGRVGDRRDIVEYRDMLSILRDRFRDAVGSGLDAGAGQGAGPTLDFDGR